RTRIRCPVADAPLRRGPARGAPPPSADIRTPPSLHRHIEKPYARIIGLILSSLGDSALSSKGTAPTERAFLPGCSRDAAIASWAHAPFRLSPPPRPNGVTFIVKITSRCR